MKRIPKEKFKNGQIVKVKFYGNEFVGKILVLNEYVYLCNNRIGCHTKESKDNLKDTYIYGYTQAYCFMHPRDEYTAPELTFFLPRELDEVVEGDILRDASNRHIFVNGKEGNHIFGSLIDHTDFSTYNIRRLYPLKDDVEVAAIFAYSTRMLKENGWKIHQPENIFEVTLEEIAKWKGISVSDLRIKE